jgi:hypothetical protein
MSTLRAEEGRSRHEDARAYALLLGMAGLTFLPPLAMAQSLADSDFSSAAVPPSSPGATHPLLGLAYTRPTEKTKLDNHFFETFGPNPIFGAVLVASINQAECTPARVGTRSGGLWQPIWVQLCHRSSQHHDPLYVGESVQ